MTGRPKGPGRVKFQVNVLPRAKDWIRLRAIEKHGSSYAMGRVVEELVASFVEVEDATQAWREQAERMEEARDDIQRVAVEAIRERDSLRRQLAESRARRRASRARF